MSMSINISMRVSMSKSVRIKLGVGMFLDVTSWCCVGIGYFPVMPLLLK